MPMISVRVDDDAAALFDKRADEAGVSRSVWVRESLMAAANPSNGMQAHPARALAVQRGSISTAKVKDCQHPPQARRDLPFSVVCGVCGDVIRRR